MSPRVEHLAEGVTLYCGDCREILPGIKADAIVTDPPYGIGIASNPVRQKHEKKEWDAQAPDASVFDMIFAASDQQIIWGGNYFGLPAAQGFLIWDKKQPENFTLAMCEMAWVSRKMPAKIWRQSVLSYEKDHPTQKPVPLMEWCIQHLSHVRTVCDPFMGSGTTGVAAVRLGLKFIGIELEAEYFDLARRRIEAALRQPDMFTAPPPAPKQEALL